MLSVNWEGTPPAVRVWFMHVSVVHVFKSNMQGLEQLVGGGGEGGG